MKPQATVIGAGLAGAEAAWQLAQAGIHVALVDMKPQARSPAHTADLFCELVCSNSLRSDSSRNAVGVLKDEMRALGSLVLHCADANRVPAGSALAVDRHDFATAITSALCSHPHIQVRSELVVSLPDVAAGPVIICTGPLTAADLAADIARVAGHGSLYFYDAVAPIVSGESIDRSVAYAASRYGKGGGNDYLNCPLSEPQYRVFLEALLAAACMPLHPFEEPRYFSGCMPIEVLARSGPDTLRHGPMKPVGLWDPRSGQIPHAVVQLRQEDRAGQAFNLVGFQTKLLHGEQRRVFRLLPGLENAEFLRLGAIHRNTFLDSPTLLDEHMRLRALPHVRFAGQITGVEGYVESAAHGLVTALLLASELRDQALNAPPTDSCLGALYSHVLGRGRLPNRPHEPQNIHWGMFPPLPGGSRKSAAQDKRLNRALVAAQAWQQEVRTALGATWPD